MSLPVREVFSVLSVSVNAKGKEMQNPFLNCVGAGRAKEVLFAPFQEALGYAQSHIGFNYLRFHGLFHEDMYVLPQGAETPNFIYIDEVFDRMLEKNIRPFVELSFMPQSLASGTQTQFIWKSNVTPPKDWNKWGRLIEACVRHWQERYGAEEVSRWYFEVWNEPNLNAFWSGTRSEYFRLYGITAETIKSINPALRGGGPATSNFVPDDRFAGEREDETKAATHAMSQFAVAPCKGVWIREFLDYCAQNRLPVDFVSTHPYPTDFALDTDGVTRGKTRHILSLSEDLRWLREAVSGSAYPDAQIHLTEWSSSPSSRDTSHDGLREAVYVARQASETMGMADSVSYWALSDVFEEIGAGPSLFHGGFGLLHYHAIRKPVFTAYEMLSGLGSTVLVKGRDHLMTRRQGTVSGILWYDPLEETPPMHVYPEEESDQELPACEKTLVLTGLAPGEKIRVRYMDNEHGWAKPLWVRNGRHPSPDRKEISELKAAAESLGEMYDTADEKGELTLKFAMKPWAMYQIQGEALL